MNSEMQKIDKLTSSDVLTMSAVESIPVDEGELYLSMNDNNIDSNEMVNFKVFSTPSTSDSETNKHCKLPSSTQNRRKQENSPLSSPKHLSPINDKSAFNDVISDQEVPTPPPSPSASRSALQKSRYFFIFHFIEEFLQR